MRNTLKILSSILLIASLVHCGAADFSGSSNATPPKGKTPKGSGNQTPSASLTWMWPCGANNKEIENAEGNLTLIGPGPHSIAKEGLEGRTLVVKGNACNITATRRNVVFVIDVSGSMERNGVFKPGNDPLRNGTCGRLQAVQEVISAIKLTSNARFGVATFEDSTIAASSDLFAGERDLYNDLLATSGQSHIANVICRGSGGTDYNAGLQSAQNLLALYDDEKDVDEIYFISDGQPNPGDEGIALAQQLRSEDVLIGTVMVGSANDSVLKNSIASRDSRNAPYHSRVDSSSELAKVLARLADNQVAQGIASYSESGDDSAIGELDFTGRFAGTSFAFEAFELNLEEVPTGFSLEIVIKDRFGDEETKSGEVRWISD